MPRKQGDGRERPLIQTTCKSEPVRTAAEKLSSTQSWVSEKRERCKTRRESSPSSTSWENVWRRTSDHQEDVIRDGGNEVLFNDQITKRRTTWSGSDSHALPHAQTHQR